MRLTVKQPIKPSGFTLIELMIVVAIVGILAAVALPSYKRSVDRSNRASARAQLLQASQYMQRFYAANDRYDATRGGADTVWATLPTALKQSPNEGTATYEISDSGTNASTVTTSTYTLIMRPVSGGAMANDSCGGFSITQAGVKGITGIASPTSAQIAECWK